MKINSLPKPLIRKIDCVRIYVPNLDDGLAFYRDKLGHQLIWRTEHAIGLRLPETEAEIVIQNENKGQEIDFTVDSVEEATHRIMEVGAKVIIPPFDIPIGHCVILQDPWGNQIVLLDCSKGLYATDSNGNVIGHIEH
jgi:predicted enzyme related to lactoylglutathione lyase